MRSAPRRNISPQFCSMFCYFVSLFFFFLFCGQPHGTKISQYPKQPCWLYALIALQQYSPLPRCFYPSENWLSSRCLTSVIMQELVSRFGHQLQIEVFAFSLDRRCHWCREKIGHKFLWFQPFAHLLP